MPLTAPRTLPLVAGAAFCVFGATSASAQTWLNGTGQAAECDFCILQFPSVLSAAAGAASGPVYGRIFEAGVTEAFGASGLLAQLGHGARGSDPRDGGWTWVNAGYGGQAGNDDEYVGSFGPLAAGQYGYTFRFSFDGGQSYTLADLDGAGSNAGLSFNPAGVGLLNVVGPVTPPPATGWLNGTGNVLECDFCALQFPAQLSAVAGQASDAVFGRLYEAGVTEGAGAAAGVSVDLGWGAAGSDPRDGGWTWSAASFTGQIGNEEEFVASLTPTAAGTYHYTFRFSLDGGQSWTLGDLDGAGSNAGLAFDTAQLGVLTVSAVPEPGTWALWGAGLGLLGTLARRRTG